MKEKARRVHSILYDNKGFTLTEILAVIVLLAVILTLVVPTFLETSDTAKQKLLDTKVESIVSSAIVWAQDNPTCFKSPNQDKCKVSAKEENIPRDINTYKIGSYCTASSGKYTCKMLNNCTSADNTYTCSLNIGAFAAAGFVDIDTDKDVENQYHKDKALQQYNITLVYNSVDKSIKVSSCDVEESKYCEEFKES